MSRADHRAGHGAEHQRCEDVSAIDHAADQDPDQGLDSASPIAAMGASLKMVELYRALADESCHFLIVQAPSDKDTQRLMNIVRHHGFRIVQRYQRRVIEMLDSPLGTRCAAPPGTAVSLRL